jgi:holo-ACP synthase CitX
MGITLEQLLESRDARALRQRDLLGKYPGRSLVSMTVQLPGPVKRNALSLIIAQAGVKAVREALAPEYEELKDLETGYEGFFLVPVPPLELKRITCSIEDAHPLGRLLDLDVLACPGEGAAPVLIGREEIGLPQRKCLLCGRPARWCMRERTHSTEALLQEIERIVNNYHP